MAYELRLMDTVDHTQRFGLSDRPHLRLLRRLVPLAVIAASACCHHVLPAGFSPTRTGNDVIQCQLRGRKGFATVLARVLVPDQHVLTREFHQPVGNMHIVVKPDHERHPDRDTRRADHHIRFILRARNPLENQAYRSLHVTDIDGFIACVEYEDTRVHPHSPDHIPYRPYRTKTTDIQIADIVTHPI